MERRAGDLTSLTLAEFAAWASPPISVKLLQCLVNELAIDSDGTRRTTQRGRPAPTYPAGTLHQLHADLGSWLRRATPK